MYEGNPLYCSFLPEQPTEQSVLDDMAELPPACTADAKAVLGFFESGALRAVLDVVMGYPAPSMAFIGLFMVDAAVQGRGLGRKLITCVLNALAANGAETARLAIQAGNAQSRAFWLRCGFAFTGEQAECDGCKVLLMERML